jgi:hypothetical protein
VKRLLSFTIVIGLILVGPSPVSLCALASSLAADCESMDKPSPCGQLDMPMQPSETWKVQMVACCAISQSPLPEAKNDLSSPGPEQDPATVSILSAEATHAERHALADVLRDPSPPPKQSLLCTFLL